MSLFDANEYTRPGSTPRTPKHARWKYAARKTPGVIHCGSHRSKIHAGAPIVTFCGIIGTPLTYGPGEVGHGCAEYVDRGAPVNTPLAS